MAVRLVVELVERALKVVRVTPRADGDHRQQPSVARCLRTHDGIQETAHLGQGVVEDLGQAVTVVDQPLDGVEPDAADCVTCANRPSSLGSTVRVKKWFNEEFRGTRRES